MHRPPIIVIVVAGISSPANVLQMEVSLLCVWGKLEIAKRSLGINRPFEVLELDFSGYAGGLNGSTQHSSRTRLALKTKAKSLARVRSAGTLPWLGFDRRQPNRS